MKSKLCFIVGLFCSISIYAQTNGEFSSAKLTSGYPKDLELTKKHLGLENLTYARLETGIDSIKIIFGELTQGISKGYWVLSRLNNFTKFSTVSLKKDNSSDYLSNNIVINIDNSHKTSMYIKHNPIKNEVYYSWLAGDKKLDKLTVQKIQRILEKNKKLPELILKSLTDRTISTIDYKGKTLVINWWATSCAPYRTEIPGLNKLVDKYSQFPNIVFLAIAFDQKKKLKNYLKSNDFKYLQSIGDDNISKIFGESFPKNLIVNPEGIITYYSEGGNEDTYKTLEKELLRQLN